MADCAWDSHARPTYNSRLYKQLRLSRLAVSLTACSQPNGTNPGRDCPRPRDNVSTGAACEARMSTTPTTYPHAKTKIVATVGPACGSVEQAGRADPGRRSTSFASTRPTARWTSATQKVLQAIRRLSRREVGQPGRRAGRSGRAEDSPRRAGRSIRLNVRGRRGVPLRPRRRSPTRPTS